MFKSYFCIVSVRQCCWVYSSHDDLWYPGSSLKPKRNSSQRSSILPRSIAKAASDRFQVISHLILSRSSLSRLSRSSRLAIVSYFLFGPSLLCVSKIFASYLPPDNSFSFPFFPYHGLPMHLFLANTMLFFLFNLFLPLCFMIRFFSIPSAMDTVVFRDIKIITTLAVAAQHERNKACPVTPSLSFKKNPFEKKRV